MERTALQVDGPLMNANERRWFDDLTEQVLGAVFEVSNTLGRDSWRGSTSVL